MTADVVESDLASMAVGQTASVAIAAVDAQVTGKVTAIAPTAVGDTTGGVVSYAVTVSLQDVPPAVRAGMTADVTITIDSATNVLTVPAAALRGSTGNYTVLVIGADGTPTAQPVEVGPDHQHDRRDQERPDRRPAGRHRGQHRADRHADRDRRLRRPGWRLRWRLPGRQRPARDRELGRDGHTTDAIISLDHVSRIYAMGRMEVPALADVSLEVHPGEFVAIVGPSGSGKTTMMNILGCLDRPTSGAYRLAGSPVADLDDDGLAKLRSRSIGFVFQSYNLLPRTTALDNVATPLLYQGVSRRDRAARAKAALERLGMGDRLDHEPTELSGGQQQRVAVARALVTEPALILADEPTGNLDSHAGADVMALLHELNAAGRTIVLITHDPEIAASANRQIHLRDGRIVA